VTNELRRWSFPRQYQTIANGGTEARNSAQGVAACEKVKCAGG